jgi:hypothetical protein
MLVQRRVNWKISETVHIPDYAVVYIAAISFRDQGHFSTSSFSLNLHFKNTIHQHA